MQRRTYRPRSSRLTYRRRPLLLTRRPMRRVIQNVINQNLEKKYADVSFTLTPTPSALLRLTGVSQSDTDSTRDGDKIKVLSVKMRSTVLVADATNFIRVILFQWHSSSSVNPPGVTAILQTQDLNSHYNHDGGALYSIFYDRVYALEGSGNAAQNINAVARINKVGKTKWVKPIVKFESGTIEATDHFYMLVISDSTASPSPLFSGVFRTTYTDA